MKKEITQLKSKASALYYALRARGLSHSMALAAVVESVLEGSPAFKVASSTRKKKGK